MKTTFDIPEPLLREVQRLAAARGTTTRSVVEQALLALLSQAETAEQFVLADAAVGGSGLRPEFEGASWAVVRDAAYGDLPAAQVGS